MCHILCILNGRFTSICLLFYKSLIIQDMIYQIVFGNFDLYFLQFITNTSHIKTAQKTINNLINKNIFHLKVSSLRQDVWYLGITNLCKNTYFIYKLLQYTCFNWTYFTCSYIKWVWDISQYNKLFNFQYARFQILAPFGLFWSASIPTMVHVWKVIGKYENGFITITFLSLFINLWYTDETHYPSTTYYTSSGVLGLWTFESLITLMTHVSFKCDL